MMKTTFGAEGSAAKSVEPETNSRIASDRISLSMPGIPILLTNVPPKLLFSALAIVLASVFSELSNALLPQKLGYTDRSLKIFLVQKVGRSVLIRFFRFLPRTSQASTELAQGAEAYLQPASFRLISPARKQNGSIRLRFLKLRYLLLPEIGQRPIVTVAWARAQRRPR